MCLFIGMSDETEQSEQQSDDSLQVGNRIHREKPISDYIEKGSKDYSTNKNALFK